MSQVLPKPKPLSDQLDIIVKGCRENNLHCQEQLYKLCYPDMIRICHRYAGDLDGAGTIYNNGMLKIFKAISHYQEEGKFMGWIKTIIVNCCIDFSKQQNRFMEKNISASHEEPAIEPEVFHSVSAKEIQNIIFQLPKATATVFNLFIYEGFSHREISHSLGISEGTSKWHVNEARKKLKSELEQFFNPAIKTNAAG